MSVWLAERQAQRRAELAAALKPQPRRAAWTPEQQARHRTVLEEALDGTEWHQPIPARRQASRRPRKDSR
ncbi:hypothetical protein ACFWJT_15645 [Streptomyces sp. NPDC127069]|uniref:hypothetical protein n=1 Tax=Streptomyces sp. NPDC127069 TaxID=3347128 RepID=UPI00364E1359